MMTEKEFARMFVRERARFARHEKRARRAWLAIYDRHHTPGSKGGFRDVASADLETGEIAFSRRALRWSKETLVGIVRHELGHLCDPTPHRPGAEQRADDLAERFGGKKIRYGRWDRQTIGRGIYPRPLHLHR